MTKIHLQIKFRKTVPGFTLIRRIKKRISIPVNRYGNWIVTKSYFHGGI